MLFRCLLPPSFFTRREITTHQQPTLLPYLLYIIGTSQAPIYMATSTARNDTKRLSAMLQRYSRRASMDSVEFVVYPDKQIDELFLPSFSRAELSLNDLSSDITSSLVSHHTRRQLPVSLRIGNCGYHPHHLRESLPPPSRVRYLQVYHERRVSSCPYTTNAAQRQGNLLDARMPTKASMESAHHCAHYSGGIARSPSHSKIFLAIQKSGRSTAPTLPFVQPLSPIKLDDILLNDD